MPIETPHFGLKAFVLGDAFSASVDRERFLRIDHHLAFLSDIIGPGVIEGWTLSTPSPLTLRVSAGWGMIDRHITRTFGYLDKSILDNNTVYVWMKRRQNVIGQVSAFDGPVFIDYQDTTPPSTPAGLAVVNKTTSSVTLGWTANSESDLDEYILYRSADNITFTEIDRTEETEYTDIDLLDDTFYYYKVAAVDRSGHVSVVSSSISVKTFKDTSQPGDPSNIRITNSENAVNIVWRRAAFGNIAYYRAYVTPVTQEGLPDGDTFMLEVLGTIQYMAIHGLTNNQRYEIILKSVGTNDIESNGVRVYGYPADYNGPLDITALDITDLENTGALSKIIMKLEWSPYFDPYDAFPAVSFEIQLEEIADGRVFTSEWIEVPEGFSTQLQVYPYLEGGQIAYRPIMERTEYFVTVIAIAENGSRSRGFVAYHKTRSFQKPDPPQNMAITQRNDQTLLVTWQNSPSIFLYNALTFNITEISSMTVTAVLDEENYGRSTSYSVISDYIAPGRDYEFRLKAVDEFGNESAEISNTFSIPDLANLPRPPVPPGQIGFAGDGQVDLAWSPPDIPYVRGFRVWRAPDQISYEATDFQIVETILDSNTHTYTDYEVENDSTYIYFITTIDVYGRESLNPVDDEYFDYNLVLVTPRPSGFITSPESLSASVVGTNSDSVRLNWEPTGGQFDGYEVYRSVGNKYSWVKIAITNPAVTTYQDNVVLTKDDVYYYIVRKFRSEADLFVTESRNTVSGAILIGKVTTEDGSFTFDVSNVRDIKDLEDPIREHAQALIAVHKHAWYGDDDDRRINLSDTVTVSDWTSFDYQTYLTDTDISDTTTYKVYINSEESEFLSNLNKETGELFFERRLAAGEFSFDPNEEFPFSEPPTVEVVFSNLPEVQNQLPRNRFDGVSAQQMGGGLIEKVQLPGINHEGRIKERLLPVQVDMLAIDEGYRYSTVDEDEIIGSALVWYDVILDPLGSDLLIASTSDGIYISPDFGTTWQMMFKPLTPALKLFYSAEIGLYFALTNRGVLVSGGNSGETGGFNVWSEVSGMETTKVARHIVEDGDGNIFCSSDLGVYKLLRLAGRGSFTWVQTPIFGPRSTDAYAMLYDDTRNRVIVSNELGIFQTSNAGANWTFSSEMPEQRPIYDFYKSGDTIFAVSKFMVWRRGASDSVFTKVATLDVSMIRRVIAWKNRLFITTDDGLLISKPDLDIYGDSELEFELAYPSMNRLIYTAAPTSLNVVADRLIAGTEERLFVSTRPGRIAIMADISIGIVPTVYIDGVEQHIGYRYTTSTDRTRKFLCFDEKQKLTAKITVANQYKRYYAVNKGWTDTDFGSKVFVYLNGKKINEGSIAEKPIQAMAQIRWPVYNDRNAHKATADLTFAKVQTSMETLLTFEQRDQEIVFTQFTKENVKDSLFKIEKFMSQIYRSARVIEELDEDGVEVFRDQDGNIVDQSAPGATKSYIPFVLPAFNVLLLSCDIDLEDVGVTSFGQYNTLYAGSSGPGLFGNELDEDGQAAGSGGLTEPGGTTGGGTTGGSGSTSGGSTSSGGTTGGSGRGLLGGTGG